MDWLKNWIMGDYCDTNPNYPLKEVMKANEDLKEKIVTLQNIQNNVSLICKYVNCKNEVIYLNPFDNKNGIKGIIFVNQLINENKISGINFYGDFELYGHKTNSELQKVFTKFRYDLDGVPYCEIIDFLCYGEKGYGTAMMNCLKDYLSLYNVRYIKGTVSIFDKYDFNDKQHYNRLRHFYEKLGYSFYQIGKGEYMRLELNNSKEMRERIYLKESYYEQEFDCYRNLVSDLLVSHRIKISEIDRNIRIYEPAYFVYAVKFSENLDEMLEVLSLLCEDIDSLSADSEQREELISYLSLFVCPIRYFTNNERMISFVKNARNKYFSKKS